ncbi:MAG: dockerin type I repeat-containing protein [Ruminococcus sp.]|nr:dockerin type I repeat-containing protein [Ruminococcus sp.]
MNKNLKKMLATVSAVATCAVSMTAITSNALYIYNTAGITPYTVSFTSDGHKYGVWQEMNDYFNSENLKFFVSEDGTRNILLCNGNIVLWGFYGYELKNEEDVVSLTKYLSDNNIPYTEEIYSEYTHIDLTRVIYKDEENESLYTSDEYFQLLQKIKEDTGFVQMIVSPNEAIRIKDVTDVENILPEPTLLGDANEDGKVTIADAVLIMQALSNPNDFQLTPQGIANADIVGDGDGVTVMDALRIQEMEINM